jgi:thiol-disulfide isomerase/thioredoxin
MQVLIVVLALTILAYLVWRLWKPVVAPKREVKKDHANLYFFHTEWCGFCKKAGPEWEALQSGPSTFGTTTVSFIPVDCDKDKATCDLYAVSGYPTVKLETSTGLYEYTKQVTQEKLLAFLRESLGKEA